MSCKCTCIFIGPLSNAPAWTSRSEVSNTRRTSTVDTTPTGRRAPSTMCTWWTCAVDSSCITADRVSEPGMGTGHVTGAWSRKGGTQSLIAPKRGWRAARCASTHSTCTVHHTTVCVPRAVTGGRGEPPPAMRARNGIRGPASAPATSPPPATSSRPTTSDRDTLVRMAPDPSSTTAHPPSLRAAPGGGGHHVHLSQRVG